MAGGYIEAQSVCGVYGTYTDPVTGSVYQMNGGCTDPETASKIIEPTNTTNESTLLGSFDFTSWWNSFSQNEQLLIVGGIGLVGWQWMKEKGKYSRRGLQ
jgi:hypothetical protein